MFEVTEIKRLVRHSGCGSREWNKASRIHVFQDKESILENIVNRRARPSKLYKEVVLDKFPDLAGQIRWSQTAGCSCGCSPGFIVNHTMRNNGRPLDIYITAKFS